MYRNISRRIKHISSCAFMIGTCVFSSQSFAQDTASTTYWNAHTHLNALRLPLPPIDYQVEYLDLNHDGHPDAIKSMTINNTPILWLDDNHNMKKGDLEGDMVSDCLLVDRNKDGQYGGQGDLIIDWVDTDNDGTANMQFVIEYPPVKTGEVWPNGHYMIMLDLDKDNIFNYINWDNFKLKCWDRIGQSNFYEDYSGHTAFMKIHTSTYDMEDLRINWENPFLFYDPDNDGLSEIAVRVLDSPELRDPKAPRNSYINRQMQGRCTWASIGIDLDNDNTPGNDFDFDFTLGFQGKGFDYKNQVHRVQNIGGLKESDQFFMDPRYRHLTEFLYPDHDAALDMIFEEGDWNRINFVYDEDDDCGRWERVEFYDPLDPFKVGTRKGGIDNNVQSDPAGDRGEWDLDNSGKAKLYISRFDGRLHLYGAEKGAWRIDQNVEFYQGHNRTWMNKDPKSFATVLYEDKDNNGFFDHIEYDLDGDAKCETVIDFRELGIDDQCNTIDVSKYTYDNYLKLGKKLSSNMWKNATRALEVARHYGIQTLWYAKYMTPKSSQEKYSYGYWLQFYLYKDLENYFLRMKNKEKLTALHKAYFSGNWEMMLNKR